MIASYNHQTIYRVTHIPHTMCKRHGRHRHPSLITWLLALAKVNRIFNLGLYFPLQEIIFVAKVNKITDVYLWRLTLPLPTLSVALLLSSRRRLQPRPSSSMSLPWRAWPSETILADPRARPSPPDPHGLVLYSLLIGGILPMPWRRPVAGSGWMEGAPPGCSATDGGVAPHGRRVGRESGGG